jgi:hypothetical protein
VKVCVPLFASDQSPVVNPQPCRLNLVFNNLVVAATVAATAAIVFANSIW